MGAVGSGPLGSQAPDPGSSSTLHGHGGWRASVSRLGSGAAHPREKKQIVESLHRRSARRIARRIAARSSVESLDEY